MGQQFFARNIERVSTHPKQQSHAFFNTPGFGEQNLHTVTTMTNYTRDSRATQTAVSNFQFDLICPLFHSYCRLETAAVFLQALSVATV